MILSMFHVVLVLCVMFDSLIVCVRTLFAVLTGFLGIMKKVRLFEAFDSRERRVLLKEFLINSSSSSPSSSSPSLTSVAKAEASALQVWEWC
jgi:hypothetical protein